MKRHYARQGSTVTACGRVYRDAPKSHLKRSVTCLRCRATRAWEADAYRWGVPQ